MKNKIILVVLALVLLGGGVGNSSMWVGPEIGPNFNTSMKATTNGVATLNLNPQTSVMSGLTVGYDFNNYGAGAYDYPKWMQYFGVMVDFSYNPLYYTAQSKQFVTNNVFGGQIVNLPTSGTVSGSNVALTFMVVGRIPLMVDSDYPRGRVLPYAGVGPSILWTTLDFNNMGGGNKTVTNVALVMEAGIRGMLTPALSMDVAYRYRYANPTMDVDLPGIGNTNIEGGSSNHQGIVRVSYHF